MNGKCYKTSKWPCGEQPYSPKKWNKSGNSVLASHNCYTYMLNDLYSSPRVHGKPQPGWSYKLKSKNSHYKGINKLSCSDTIKAVRKDNPQNLKILSINKGKHFVPPPLHYKGILVVSPNMDYHFARQDNRFLKVYDKILTNKQNNFNDTQLLKTLMYFCMKYIPEICKYIPLQSKTLRQKLRFVYKNSKTWSHKPGATNVSDKDADNNLIFDPLKANWDFSQTGGINYNKNCCFFICPMNSYQPTFSSGIPNMFGSNQHPDIKTRADLGTTIQQQDLDKRVKRLLFK